MSEIEKLLDECFPDFQYRKYQKETIINIIEAIANPNIKYIVLSAPTGSGKSVIARHIAEVYNRITNKETLFITKTISLQNQYLEDFPEIKKLMGASNYNCNVEWVTPIPPSLKYHEGCKHVKSSGMCEYGKARSEYISSPLKCLNYAFLMAGILQYNTNGLLIADECHNLETSILDKLDCEVNIHYLERLHLDDISLVEYLGDFSKITEFTKFEAQGIIEYLKVSIDYCENLILNLNSTLESISKDQDNVLKIIESQLNPLNKKLNSFKSVYFTLLHFVRDNEKHWVVSKVEHIKDLIFKIKPIFIPKQFHKQIFGNVNKVLLMSATAERVAEELHLPNNETVFISSPYIFDLKHRPIYALTSLPNLNRSTFETVYPKYIDIVDELINQYDNKTNMLIHTVSYKNAELLKERSTNGKRMIIPTSDQLRNIKGVAGNGAILLSPSMTEGIDLADGLAKVQIFIKMPYPFLGDDWISTKKDLDENWYDYTTIRTVIQGSGRGIRGPNDTADTIILDPSFGRLYERMKEKIPEWFKSTIEWV